MIYIPISYGELYDKLTILEIKKEKIQDQDKLANIILEYNQLYPLLEDILDAEYYNKLKIINLKLWHIEDHIRIKEKNQEFDDEFIQLARSVYKCNDERAQIKREINIEFGSTLIEEKSYEKY